MPAGQRIDDHSFLGMQPGKNSPLPEGCHMKYYESGGMGGELKEYQDTSKQVKALQDANVAKMKKHEQPPMNRN